MTQKVAGWERALEVVRKQGTAKDRKAGIAVLAKLTPLQRSVFQSCELKGNDQATVARLVGCKEKDVEKHLKAAKEKLDKTKLP